MKKIIETERLIIRHPSPEDSESCFKNFMHDKSLLQFQDWCYCDSLDEVALFLSFDSDSNYWLLELKDTHQIIGDVSYSEDFYPHLCGISVGWNLGENFCHKGYMTEAVKALNNSYLSGEQGINIDYISCQYNSLNHGSEGVCRRTGFIEEARLKNRRMDMFTKELGDLVICTIHNKNSEKNKRNNFDVQSSRE